MDVFVAARMRLHMDRLCYEHNLIGPGEMSAQSVARPCRFRATLHGLLPTCTDLHGDTLASVLRANDSDEQTNKTNKNKTKRGRTRHARARQMVRGGARVFLHGF